MDRLNQLRAGGEADRGGDATLDTSSPPSEAYMSANESSKYFSLSDSTFDISPIKDVSLASAAGSDDTMTDPGELLSNLSAISKKDAMLDSFKIGKQIEAANILSGGVDIFEDNDNSFDGDELVIDDNVDMDDKSNLDDKTPLEEAVSEGTLVETHVDVASKDTEVMLQIDGKNVDAIDIGNGLYLYRKEGQEELAAVQIITEDNQQAPSFKFLKVRENAEGNLEVYEEFEIEVSKDMPVNEAKPSAKKSPHVPIKDMTKVTSESSSNKVVEKKDKSPPKQVSTSKVNVESENEPESKELNLNGKMMKFNESRKSPVVGSFTPMTYPNKEGKPLTKTMVDQQLHPSRHSDNVKKTIEVHTDSQTKKIADESSRQKSEGHSNLRENTLVLESQDKKDSEKDNDGISKISKPEKNPIKELQNVISDDQTNEEIDTIVSPTPNTVEPTKVLDNKPLEKEGSASQTLEVEIKDLDNKDKGVVPKPIDTKVPQKSIDDLLKKNLILSSLVGASGNQISQSNTDKAVVLSDSVLETDNVSKIDDGSNKSDKNINIGVVESAKPKTNKVDQVLDKSKENEQGKINSLSKKEKIQEAVSKIDLFSTNQNKEVTIPRKESPITINDVSSSSILQTQTLKPIEVQKDSKADDAKQVEENKLLASSSSIPTATKLRTTNNQVKGIDKTDDNVAEEAKDTEQKIVLEAEKSCQVEKSSEPKVQMKTEQLHSVAKKNEDNITKHSFAKGTEPKPTLQTEINKIESKVATNPDELNPTKGMDLKTVSNIEKMNPIAKGIVTKTDPQHDKLNLVAKPIEETTNKSNPASKVVTLTAEMNILDKKLEPRVVSQTNKFISVAKVSKPVLLNPIEKKIESVAVSQTFKIIAGPKANEPKTYSKTETSLLPKAVEAKTASKSQVVTASKGFELKTVPKTVLLNPVPKGIIPKPLKIEDMVPGAPKIPKSNAVIITSNKIIAPSRVESLANVDIKIPEASSNVNPKPINNNHAAVPFGKWTDANRQEFLNKFKEIKVPATSNTKQIKNSNDLNRIDVLKKIDSQRCNTASAKALDKSNIKDTVFSNKIAPPKTETKIPVKNEGLKMKAKPVDNKSNPKPEGTSETVSSTVSNVGIPDVANLEPEETREVNVNDLIGRAIVDMLNRPVPMPMTRSPLDEPRQVDNKDAHITQTEANTDQKNLNTDQQKVNKDHPKIKTDLQKLNIDQEKLNTEQQKLIIDQQELTTDQQKLKIDQGKQNTDQQKLNTDQQKLNTDQQKLKADQRKQNTDQQNLNTDQEKLKADQRKLNTDQQKLNIEQKIDEDSSGSLDYIEMKMNELHGIPFVERPPHELPRVHKTYSKSSKDNKKKGSKKLLPATSKQTLVQENVIDLESDEEVIEHEPITGDINLTKKPVSKLPALIKAPVSENKAAQGKEAQKTETVITENDFEKFARRNSITLEDCLTVKFDAREPANLEQTMKEKDATKVNPKNEMNCMEAMTKLPYKQASTQIHPSKIRLPEDPNNKNYQSKIHTAYQSALTAKRQMDRPITIIEDKPVKVVFMDPNAGFVPNQLNVQGKELSPAKKADLEFTKVSPQPVSSDVTDTIEDKQKDDTKAKTKHQRKQVLTPVEAPELELIQPRDLGLDISPKKKRKTDDNISEKSVKNLIHKKSYLLGRAGTDEKTAPREVKESPSVKETINQAEIVTERTVSAIDSLVKAAELLENQSVHSASPNPDSQQNTPVKRGRGRPRKYPLPEGATSKIVSPSPQKKPRLIDAKHVKRDPISDEESSDEEQMIRENWTMGKINENIVCPICNKLFRSENVVFKHVKHCTGVSPTRSDLEKRSPRRRRYSRDSDNKSFDSQSDDIEFDYKPKESVKSTPKKRKSKESVSKPDEVDIIVIEDTPVKEQATINEPKSMITEQKQKKTIAIQEPAIETQEQTQEKTQKGVVEKVVKEKTLKEIADMKSRAQKLQEVKAAKEEKVEEPAEDKPVKAKKLSKTTEQRSSNLVCEFCGKSFRQLSYLANHKLQHKKEQLKKLEAKLTAKLQVFKCEICKKEFRKLHHLVQHRIIHNPEAPTRTTRKSSSEQIDTKVKEQPAAKQNDDTSAGFRCEPCDKSFRKLHHLVEHRETHDGINRQKTNTQTAAPPIEKPPPPPQCDVCKKIFRKLHHLIEHKEQHHVEQVETGSEKSDDKSVQSSLSTRDIIHECSLCYMVFPNEHSLNKHFLFCQQKKKRQSKAKDKPENVDGVDVVEESTITEKSTEDDEPKIVAKETIDDKVESEKESKTALPDKIEKRKVSEKPADNENKLEAEKLVEVSEIPITKEKEVTELKTAPVKRDLPKSDTITADVINVIPEKIKKIDDQVKELPKKTPVKDKVAPSVTKRQKSIVPLPVLPEGLPIESSDDDEVRYMLNPNFKADETSEGKVFMKVRSHKRNSLQIERPNSRDLMNRRTSLQHPPKIPRLKAKAVEPKVVPIVTKNVPKPPKLESTSTDSDDSDVKYSFPGTVTKPAPTEETPKEKKAPRKSLAEKRKSLGGIAKRKSMGKAIAKLTVNQSPIRIIKRRTLDVEHRCDCGQLFNSAALLTRHTSLAHTPPRIRRRRSPPPEPSAPPPRYSTAAQTTKSSVRSDASTSKPTRKSSVKSDTAETRKSIKPDQSQAKSSAKLRRNAAHRGVPVPEKMRKMMMKNAK